MGKWKDYKYKNLTLLFISLIIALFLSRFEPFQQVLLNLGSSGYLGVFLAGILFVSTFTVATSILILFTLAEIISPLEIGLIAGLGAFVGDFTIFKLIKNDLLGEIKNAYSRFDTNGHLTGLLYTKYFTWTLPVVGAVLIASPFSDELGISLMGLSKLKTYQFVLLSFILNSLGIFFIVSAAVVVNP